MIYPKPQHKKERRQQRAQQKAERSGFHVAVMEAARGRCENPFCLSLAKRQPSTLHAHHIIFRSHGGSDSKENGIALCPICHKYAHEGYNTYKGDRITAAMFMYRILGELRGRPFFRWREALESLERRLF